MAYDFTTLSPNDFEQLTADLLSADWGTQLELFKAGKDGGVDLLHSRVPTNQPQAVIQCKRYRPESFNALLRSMKVERAKLEQLKPKRYVLVTSVRLSSANKSSLLRALAPYCLCTGDIYGPDELNALLRKHPHVERAHFKLWISSTAILQQVLHANIFAITDANIELTQHHISKLVVHDGFARATELLEANRHVLIVGNPGIGKTTLARMLMCRYIAEQYEPVWVVGDISQAWTIVNKSVEDSRRVFIIYDDFLGRLTFESNKFGKNEDASLMSLLDKVARSSDLRMVLTTREYILEDARQLHGAFNSRADDLVRCTLSLRDYSERHRAEVLYNHLYFSDLPDSRLHKVVTNQAYKLVIEHNSFNPRIIEGFCKHANSKSLTDDEFIEFIASELSDPSKLWEQPFRKEISSIARRLLVALWSLSIRGVELMELRNCVRSMCPEIDQERFDDDFQDALKQLDGNFVLTSRVPGAHAGKSAYRIVDFQNPSVADFLAGYVKQRPAWLKKVARAAVSLSQIENLAAAAEKLRDTHGEDAIDEDFWKTLNDRAAACESTRRRYMSNYMPYGAHQHYPAWFVDPIPIASATECRLELCASARWSELPDLKVRERIESVAGWTALLDGIHFGQAVPQAVASLCGWIGKHGRRVGIDVEKAADAFTMALHSQLLAAPDEFYVDGLDSLLTAVLCFGASPSDWLAGAFVTAIDESVNRMIDREFSSPDPDYREEIVMLRAMSRQLGVRLQRAIDRLEEHAENREEAETPLARRAPPEQERPKSDPFDIDARFKGLLERV